LGKEELKINDSGINFRRESQELILPFFEKEPDSKRISYFNEIDSLYFYQPPFGASSGIEIIFGSDEKVEKVLLYE
jgi:hypothetical protein